MSDLLQWEIFSDLEKYMFIAFTLELNKSHFMLSEYLGLFWGCHLFSILKGHCTYSLLYISVFRNQKENIKKLNTSMNHWNRKAMYSLLIESWSRFLNWMTHHFFLNPNIVLKEKEGLKRDEGKKKSYISSRILSINKLFSKIL